MKAGYRELSFSAHQIKIEIEGFRIDRLLDKAMKKGLDVRNVRFVLPIKAECWITPDDLQELKKLAKALYKITEAEHRGLEYRLQKIIKTPVKIVGTLLVLALIISQSFFVKTIEVSGYKAIPETLLRQCLGERGVTEGAYRPGIDWKAAESHIYETFPQITWLKLSYDGRKVFLNIAEAEDPVVTEEWGRQSGGEYTNIIAGSSGYIDTVSVYRGLALVEEGQYVKKGQVLVSGYVPLEPTVYDEDWPKSYYVKCSGEIWAKVPYRLNFNQERYVENTNNRDHAEDTEKSDNTEKEVVASKREKTENEIKAKLNQQIRQWAKENLPEDAEILNKDLNFSYKENIIEAGVTLEVRQQIGKEQEILIGEESTDNSGD